MTGTTFPDYPGNDDYHPGGGHQNQQQYGNGGQQNQYGQNNGNQSNYGNNAQPSQASYPNQGGYGGGGGSDRNNSYGGGGNRNQGGGGGWKSGGGGGWKGNNGGGGGGGWKRPNPEDIDTNLYKPYAVTGNPDAPQEILDKIDRIVRQLDSQGYYTRTGGLDGIETVAEKAATTHLELQLPFRDFNQKQSKFTFSDERVMATAKKFQPGFDGLKKGMQSFLGKNVRLVLGKGASSPALFLLVWTEDGCESGRDRNIKTGFSGHPIAIASSLGIPVFNLGRQDAEQRLNMYLSSLAPIPVA